MNNLSSKYRFLALDDEDHIINFYREFSGDIEVDAFKSVRDFSDAAKTFKDNPDGLSGFILDFNLGDWEQVNGIHVARNIRKDFPNHAIFLLTSEDARLFTKEIAELQIFFISKAQSTDDIKTSIKRIISSAKINPIKDDTPIDYNFVSDEIISVNGNQVQFRSKEYAIVEALLKKNPHFVQIEELKKRYDFFCELRNFNLLVSKINRKLIICNVFIEKNKGDLFLRHLNCANEGLIYNRSREIHSQTQYTLASLIGVTLNGSDEIVGPNGRAKVNENEKHILNFMLDRVGKSYPKEDVLLGMENPIEDTLYIGSLKNIQRKLKEVSDLSIKGKKSSLIFGIYRK